MPHWLTLLSAGLLVAAFPPWNFSFLIWIALIPWFAALDRTRSLRHAIVQGLWLSVFMTLGGFYWVASVLQEFGGLPWIVSVIGLLLFSLIGQPQFILFAPMWRWVRQTDPVRRRSSLGLAVCMALAYAGLDWILPKLFVDTLGHALYAAPILRQVADLGGATVLTFLIFMVNESLFRFALKIRSRQEPSLWPALRLTAGPIVVALLLVGATWGYGQWRLPQVERRMEHPRTRLQAAVIQANIGDFDKIAAEQGISGAADKVIQTFFEMSKQALSMDPKPEILIWPETSYPSTFHTPQTASELDRDQRVERFVREMGRPLLFGGYDRFDGKDYNAFFFLSPQAGGGVNRAQDLKVYRKNMLLLFGEYIPGADQFQFIKNAFPQVGNFGRGEGPSVLEVGDGSKIKAGPVICYEALFPNYVIEAARKGSDFILNITNDSWFGPYAEPHLHLALTTFRSIESRLPQLRSTNTGISALILPTGEITQPTGIYVPQVLNVSVPIIEPMPTLMKAWGDWFGPTAFILGWLGLMIALYYRRA